MSNLYFFKLSFLNYILYVENYLCWYRNYPQDEWKQAVKKSKRGEEMKQIAREFMERSTQAVGDGTK